MQGVQVWSLVWELSNCKQAPMLQLLSLQAPAPAHCKTRKAWVPQWRLSAARIYTYTCAHIYTHIHTFTHTHIHTYTYTHIHTYIHTYENWLGSFVTTHMPGPTLETLIWCRNQASFFFFLRCKYFYYRSLREKHWAKKGGRSHGSLISLPLGAYFMSSSPPLCSLRKINPADVSSLWRHPYPFPQKQDLP